MDEQTWALYERIRAYMDRPGERLFDNKREHLLMDASMLLQALEPYIPAGELRDWYQRWLVQFQEAQETQQKLLITREDLSIEREK